MSTSQPIHVLAEELHQSGQRIGDSAGDLDGRLQSLAGALAVFSLPRLDRLSTVIAEAYYAIQAHAMESIAANLTELSARGTSLQSFAADVATGRDEAQAGIQRTARGAT